MPVNVPWRKRPSIQLTLVQATNRRGRTIRCRVTCSPLVGNDKAVRGVIVFVLEEPGEPTAAG